MKIVPHLVRWHEAYAARGLVVILVDNGRQDGRERLAKWVEKGSMKFPVLWDRDGANGALYGIRAWPRTVLIGVDGKAVWVGAAGGGRLEEVIESELARKR